MMKWFKYNLMLIVVVLIAGACKSEHRKKYAINTHKALEIYTSKKDILSVEKLANILLCKQNHVYRMVDLRTPHEFAEGHIEGATNIPAKNVLDMEYYDFFNQDEFINVLYCRDKHQAVNIYMILKQLGFKNINVALGGYDFINEHIITKYGIKSGDYDGEKPKYDFLRLVVGIDEPVNDSIKRPEIEKLNPHKTVRDFDEECPDLN